MLTLKVPFSNVISNTGTQSLHRLMNRGGGGGPGPVPTVADINNHIACIGRINTLLQEIKNLELNMAVEGFTNAVDLTINGKRAEIRLIFDDLPDLAYFENLNINYEPEIFFQTLVSSIKNNVLSHQATIFKLRFEKRNRLALLISDLKKKLHSELGGDLEH